MHRRVSPVCYDEHRDRFDKQHNRFKGTPSGDYLGWVPKSSSYSIADVGQRINIRCPEQDARRCGSQRVKDTTHEINYEKYQYLYGIVRLVRFHFGRDVEHE